MVKPPAHKPPVAFLLAVWGESYIEQFLNVGLRTLLAPGNIPAMAAQYECTFVFLTVEKDRAIFEKDAAFKRLNAYCRIEFIDICDLIFGGNYSASITVAYERGMRSMGERLCDTYFIYLVSDYVMADGSLTGLMRYMAEGYSGITAGNFQIIEENCTAILKLLADPKTGVISIPPRDLMAYAFRNLHPMTVANTVNQPFCHSEHSNRLFWRIDDDTLLGRFYLRHMLCIKPERDDYVIGASCDYSFIPEMCPSGNVAHIDDSDVYCVVELQPHSHEQGFIREGGIRQEQLVKTLSEWTTAPHRGNAHTAVLFHSKALPVAVYDATLESDRYIREIEAKLPPPLPFRGHFYWTGCIEGVMDSIMMRSNQEEYYRNGVFAGVLGSPVFGSPEDNERLDYVLLHTPPAAPTASRRRRLWRALTKLAGRAPRVYPWHPHWTDYRAVTRQVESLLKHEPSCMLVACQRTPLTNWLEAHKKKVFFQKAELLVARPLASVKEKTEDTRLIFIALPSHQFKQLSQLIPCCFELLSEGGTICMLIAYETDGKFKSRIASAMTACMGSRVGNVEMRYITSPLRPFLDNRLIRCVDHLHNRRSPVALLSNALQLAALMGLYVANNLGSLIGRNFTRFGATSAIVTITVKPIAAQPAASVQQAA